MATGSIAFKSRKDRRKQTELDEARKAGLSPAELDEEGREINPHILRYLSIAPWYLGINKGPDLKHQKNRKLESNYAKSKTLQAGKYKKGAYEK